MRRHKKKSGHWATETKKKKKKVFQSVRLRKFSYYVLATAFFGVLVYAFFFSGFMVVGNIQVTGEVRDLNSDIEKEINEMLTGKKWLIFDKRNYLFVSKKEISEKLKKDFKRIESLQVEKIFPNKIKIAVVKRKFLLILCSSGQCYLVDGRGVVYAKINPTVDEVGGNRVIKIIDESGKDIYEGENIFTPKFVDFVANISQRLENETNLKLLDEFRVKSTISGEVVAQTTRGWDIFFDTNIPVEKSVRMLKLLLNKQITLKELNELEYIDLRLNGKVFYRLRGDALKEKHLLEEEKAKEEEAEKSEATEDNSDLSIE